MTDSNHMGSAEFFREAIERLIPDEPNFVRVRETGGTENRVGETVGATEETKDLHLLEEPTMVERELTAGAGDTAGDVTLHSLEDDLEEGDRIERISDGTAYRVKAVEDFDWMGEPIGYLITADEQHD